jgi:hypothetical protein
MSSMVLLKMKSCDKGHPNSTPIHEEISFLRTFLLSRHCPQSTRDRHFIPKKQESALLAVALSCRLALLSPISPRSRFIFSYQLVVCYIANLTPGELRSRLSGATGYRYCLCCRYCSISADNAIKWLLYSGLRGQQAFPVTSVDPSIIQDAVGGGHF